MNEPLGSLIRLHYGKALKTETRDASGVIPVFGSNGLVGTHTQALFTGESNIIGRKGSVGKVIYAPSGGWVIDTAFYTQIIDPNRLIPRYLFHALQSLDLQHCTIITSIPGINRDDIYSQKIPLPPLEEQRRIAAILDKADAIRRKRQEALKLVNDFLKSVFLDMFGDPVTNPKGWREEYFGDVIEDITGGWSVSGDDRAKLPGEKAVLKISAVTSGKYVPSAYKVVNAADWQGEKLLVPQYGDLLFSRANTRELVAATCIVDQEDEDLFLPDKLWIINPKKQKAKQTFLKFLLSNEQMRERLTKQATGTSGSMLNISKQKLLETKFPIPEYDYQKNWDNLFWQINSANIRQTSSTDDSVMLFSALSATFFDEK